MPPPQPNRIHPEKVRSINLDRQMGVVRFSPCGRYLAAGGYDGKIHRWSVGDDNLTEMPALEGHQGWASALAFHPDRQRLLTADSHGAVRIWRHTERNPTMVRTIANAHDGWIRDLAISADGNRFATCGRDQQVRIWNTNGQLQRTIRNHEEDVFAVAFHPNNRDLVSGDMRGNVMQWNVADSRRTRKFDCTSMHTLSRLQDVGGLKRLAFDTAGRTLMCIGSTPSRGANMQGTPTILIFDWADGRLQHTLRVGGNGDGFAYDAVLHSDGYVIAVTSGNPGTGKFWLQRPGEEQPLFLHTRMPNCHSVALHPDGNRVIVAATNSGSNGNGRRLRDGEYPGNYSPLHLWRLRSA